MSIREGLVQVNTVNRYSSANNLTPQKTRILALLALARKPSAEFVRAVLASHCLHAISHAHWLNGWNLQ